MEQVVVKTFRNLSEAELAKGLLAAEKVWSMVRGGNLSAYHNSGGETMLVVKETDLERAQLILGVEL